MIAWPPGAAQEDNFEAPQHRATQGVADPALGQVDHLGIDDIGVLLLLVGQVGPQRRFEFCVAMAEPPQQLGPGGPGGAVKQHVEVTPVDPGRAGPHSDQGGQGVGERRRGGLSQAGHVGVSQGQFLVAAGQRPSQQVGQDPVSATPARLRRRRRPEVEPGQQGRLLGAGMVRRLEADPGLLVQRLAQRHPAAAVAGRERLLEAVEGVAAPRCDAAQQFDCPGHLGRHVSAEDQAWGGFEHVDLNLPGRVHAADQL